MVLSLLVTLSSLKFPSFCFIIICATEGGWNRYCLFVSCDYYILSLHFRC